jgi:hypothetical protein
MQDFAHYVLYAAVGDLYRYQYLNQLCFQSTSIVFNGSSQISFTLPLPTLTPISIRNILFVRGSFLCGFSFSRG